MVESLLSFHLRELLRYPRYAWRIIAKPKVVNVGGVLFSLDPGASKSLRHLVYSERYERGERRCVMAALEVDDKVLEIGTGAGYLSALCAKKVGSERVVGVEANPELFALIRRNHELNGVAPEIIHGMLGSEDGVATFYIDGEFVSSSAAPVAGRSRKAIDVPVLSVAKVVGRVDPTFVLMDIEGGEAELVPEIDWARVRKLAIELHPQSLGPDGMATVLEHLRSVGFRQSRALSSNRKRFFYK